MEKFRYEAIDDAGERVSGTEEAASRGAAHLALLDRGFQSVEVTRKKSILQFEITKKRVPRKDIMHFSRQLGVFVKAGIPIMEALEVISEETTDKLLKAALLDMIERLQAGDTFASAAGAHPEAFPDYYLGILGSAELTGTLDVVLEQLADYIERDIEARGKITGALIYPAVVFVMAIVTVVILATFVLPRFKTFFDSFHATLPLPTRMLLSHLQLCVELVVPAHRRAALHRRRIHRTAPVGQGQGMARLGHPQASGDGRPRAGGDHGADLSDPFVHDPCRGRSSRGDVGDGHRRRTTRSTSKGSTESARR